MRRRLIAVLSDGVRRVRVRRLALPLGALGVIAIVVGAIVGAELPAASKGAGTVKRAGAATVERRDLVATDTESGTLGYANPSTVYNRLSGTTTWLPSVGQVIKPGGTLYKVDNNPVVLFDGTTPAYRTLSPGVSDGPDVQELNRNLVKLGFAHGEIAVNDTWQAGTTDAVDRWQASLGESQTGTITLGQVVFLPGPQLITTANTVLGSTGGGSSSGAGGAAGATASSGSASSGAASSGASSSATPASTAAVARPQFVSLTTTTTKPVTTPTTTTTRDVPARTAPRSGPPSRRGKRSGGSSSTAQLKALIALLKAEVAELRSGRGSSSAGASGSPRGSTASAGSASTARSAGGATGSSGATSSGAGVGSSGSGSGGVSAGGSATAQAILQTTSTQQVVTVQLDATKQTEAVVGEPVTVQLPDGSNVDGRITQVSPVAQSSSSSGSGGAGGTGATSGSSSSPSATIPVTIMLTGHTHLSGLDQAAVSVNFAQQRAKGVLSVPVTALIATQGGGYNVQEAASPHRLIPVTPGLYAAGYVQISGAGIYPGLQVTDSQG